MTDARARRTTDPGNWRASPPPRGPYEETELSTAVSEILDEARTILPGVQAFIGFQLVAVFNTTFWEKLSDAERMLHLVAILLNVVAMVLLMAPSLYHRQRESGYDSAGMVRLASRLLMASGLPLIGAVVIDLYLIGRLIGGAPIVGFVAAAIALVLTALLWYAMPRSSAMRERLRG